MRLGTHSQNWHHCRNSTVSTAKLRIIIPSGNTAGAYLASCPLGFGEKQKKKLVGVPKLARNGKSFSRQFFKVAKLVRSGTYSIYSYSNIMHLIITVFIYFPDVIFELGKIVENADCWMHDIIMHNMKTLIVEWIIFEHVSHFSTLLISHVYIIDLV